MTTGRNRYRLARAIAGSEESVVATPEWRRERHLGFLGPGHARRTPGDRPAIRGDGCHIVFVLALVPRLALARQQIRQLGDVGRDAPGLITGEQLARGPSARFVLAIDEGQLLARCCRGR
jgi:hypothetical protein